MDKARLALVILLLAAAACGQQWEFEQVDASRAGLGVQMTQSTDGRTYLCYGRDTSGLVRMAYKDTLWHYEDVDTGTGSDWSTPSFATGLRDEMAVVHGRWGTMRFACREDSGWAVSVLPFEGDNPVLSFDRTGAPVVLYTWDYRVYIAVRDDSVWNRDTVKWVNAAGVLYYSYAPVQYEPDNRPHVLMGHVDYYNSRLYWGYVYTLSDSAGTWITTWRDGDMHSRSNALAARFAPDGTLGTSYDLSYVGGPVNLYCQRELVDGEATQAALRFDSLGRPHMAYLLPDGTLRYAYRTGGWHVVDVPVSGVVRACDLLLDTLGEPMIAYSELDGVWLAHGSGVVGVEQPRTPVASRSRSGATIVWGAAGLPSGTRAVVLDVLGRAVFGLRPGVIDVWRLPAGVYFVVEQQTPGRERGRTYKVIVQR
jgi:hypothetical protein